MKKFPKIVQCDKRGQIVIPKDIRVELGLDEGSGFYMYSIKGEGIFLKKIPNKTLDDHSVLIDEIVEKADKLKVDVNNLKVAKQNYKKTKEGNLDLI